MVSESEILSLCRYRGYTWVSANIPLTEDFMRKYFQYLDKFWISHNQYLSEEFILEYLDELNIDILLERYYLPDEFRNRLKTLIEMVR